jgi:hypothetical protein
MLSQCTRGPSRLGGHLHVRIARVMRCMAGASKCEQSLLSHHAAASRKRAAIAARGPVRGLVCTNLAAPSVIICSVCTSGSNTGNSFVIRPRYCRCTARGVSAAAGVQWYQPSRADRADCAPPPFWPTAGLSSCTADIRRSNTMTCLLVQTNSRCGRRCSWHQRNLPGCWCWGLKHRHSPSSACVALQSGGTGDLRPAQDPDAAGTEAAAPAARRPAAGAAAAQQQPARWTELPSAAADPAAWHQHPSEFQVGRE